MHHCLSRTAAEAFLRVAVHAILGDIHVDGRKVGRTELVDLIEHLAEFKCLVSGTAFHDHFVKAL